MRKLFVLVAVLATAAAFTWYVVSWSALNPPWFSFSAFVDKVARKLPIGGQYAIWGKKCPQLLFADTFSMDRSINQIDRDTKYFAREFSGKWSVAFVFTSCFLLPLLTRLFLRLPELVFANFTDSVFYLSYSQSFQELFLLHGSQLF